MRTTTILILVLLIMGVGGGALVAGPRLMAGLLYLGPAPSRTNVQVQEAGRRALVEYITASGGIESHTQVDISAEVSARIEELPFREGDVVAKGDVVVKLDDRDLRAALDSAKAGRDGESFRLRSEQAQRAGRMRTLEFAQRTLTRQQSLFESGDVSQSVFDDAMERVDDLQASIDASTHNISAFESSLAAAEADIARAADALADTVIRSPIDGVITQLNAEIGEVVLVGSMNNAGTVIMTIADLSRMILNARVAESDIVKVKRQQSAQIHITAYPDDVFDGIVRKIALQRTAAPDGTGFFETEIEIDLQGRQIYSGLVANVDIEITEHHGIVVPMQAIVDRVADELPRKIVVGNPLVDPARKIITVVYRMVDNKAVCTPVDPGASDWTQTLVLGGLSEGEVIVTGPFKVLDELRHNELIKTGPVEPELDSDVVTNQEFNEEEAASSSEASGGGGPA